MYALQVHNPANDNYALLVGSPSSGTGTATVFLAMSDGTQLELAGWTTM